MSKRTNIVNTGGVVVVSGGSMPASTYTNAHSVLSRSAANKAAAVIVVGSGNLVEVGGDGGCFDTVAGVNVAREKTNLDTIGL